MAKVLVIEDDEFFRKAYKMKFTSSGFKIELAEDGAEGLDKLDSFKPDIVLLDLVMPKMTGFEVLKSLRAKKEYKNLPVLITSNLGQKQDMDEGMKLGATDYIVKADVQVGDIVEKVKSVLSKK